MAASVQTTRMRKAHCIQCGYVVRISRRWIAQGLPSCPCGAGELTCPELEDQIVADPELLDSLPRGERTKACHKLGWSDAIVRTSVSQEPGARRRRSFARVAADLPF